MLKPDEPLLPDEQQEAEIQRMMSEPTDGWLLAPDTGVGKANPLSEPVLTPRGWVTMADISAGDYVVGADGRPTKVLSVHPQGVQDIYRVTFNDGSYSLCTLDHLWSVQTRTQKHRQQGFRVMSTRELVHSSQEWYIPVVSPVQFDPCELPVDPYAVGVLLGDGSLTTNMPVVSTDYEIAGLLSEKGLDLSEPFDRHDYSASFRIRGFRSSLEEIGLWGKYSYEKSIPAQYLLGSVDDRIALLRGLMDTDGNVTANSTVEYSTSSEQLANDILALVRSLGLTATLDSRIPRYCYKGETLNGRRSYRLHIATSTFNPFLLKRKANRWTAPSKYLPTRKIVSITLSRREEAQCIRVEAEDHLYVTRDYVVTHNTLMAVEFVKRRGAQTVLVIGPVNTRVIKAWKDTFTRQGVMLPFKRIDSKTPEEFENLRKKMPGIYYVGREFFTISGSNLVDDETKEVKRERRWSWSKVHPEVAVFDEIQTASNRNSTTYRVLKQLDADYKIASSATPQGNRFQGLWSVCRWLWPDAKNPETGELYVDNSFWRWAATWAEVVPDPYTYQKCLGERVEGAFVSSLPGYTRIEAVRTPVEERKVYLDLTPRQRELYDQMEKDALAWIDEHPMVADLPIVQRIRMRQITLGEPTLKDTGLVDDDGVPIIEVDFADDCESSKIDALEKIIEKHHPGEPIFILVDSQKFARVVAQRLGPLAAEWSGKTSHKERDRIAEQFGNEVRFIVATIPAVAEGLDGLQKVCNVEVWVSQSLNEMLNEQARGRVNRRGQKADVIYRYYLQARGTDDDRHFQNLLDQHIQQRATLRRK